MRTRLGIIASILLLSACTPKVDFSRAAYWERTNVREAVYLNGSRAQAQLSRDIAMCVTTLKEMQTISKLRRAMPGESESYEPIVQRNLRHWDGPERDRALLAEHYDFHDFEGCMSYNGWRRVMNLPNEDLNRARTNYLKHVGKINTDENTPQKRSPLLKLETKNEFNINN